jgi:hypothetical protein
MRSATLCSRALAAAMARASAEMSRAVISAWRRWTARAMAMAPEPVPMSAIFRALSVGKSFRTASTRCSVSGRGMRTAGVTLRRRP